MADVTSSVNVFEQIRLVAGLRWRILRNSLRKKNNRLDLIGLILTGVFSSILVIGLSFAFYAGAYAFLSQGRLEWMALLFWGIFLFWQIFPVFVAGLRADFLISPLLPVSVGLPPLHSIAVGYRFAAFFAFALVCFPLALSAAGPACLPR